MNLKNQTHSENKNLFFLYFNFTSQIIFFVIIFCVSHEVYCETESKASPSKNLFFHSENFQTLMQDISIIKIFDIQTKETSNLKMNTNSNLPTLYFYVASWCGYCKAELPVLEKFASTHKEINVIGISGDLEESDAKKIPKDWNLKLTLYWDSEHKIKKIFPIKKVPFLFYVNKEGQILNFHQGSKNIIDFLNKF